MGQRRPRAYRVEMIAGRRLHGTIANPHDTFTMSAVMGAESESSAEDIATNQVSPNVGWMVITKVARCHETELASERLLSEMVCCMRGCAS